MKKMIYIVNIFDIFKSHTSVYVSHIGPPPVAVLGKNIWWAWPLIIWEATTAKRNYYRSNWCIAKI